MHSRDTDAWDREADLQAIRDTYDRYGDAGRTRLWDQHVPGYGRLVDELQGALVRTLESSIPGAGARILDLGCGDGSLAGDLNSEPGVVDWIGVDLRPEAVAAAGQRYPDLTFLLASADAVPLDAGSVDVVVTRLLFSSLPSNELETAVAAEIRRLLRPGGWLVWLDLRYANPTNPAVHGLPVRRIDRLFPGWRQELRAAGLLPPLARRLGRIARIAYPALAALPVLRSHLVGRLQRPALEP